MLWFAAPPVDIVHARAPQHSLRYLAALARKRAEYASLVELTFARGRGVARA